MSIPAMRTPMFAVEIDGSRAVQTQGTLPYKVLIIGQRLAAGTIAEAIVQSVSSADEAATKFGEGSILHQQAVKWFANKPAAELHMIALDDAAAAVAATGTIAFTGTATADGTVYILINGVQVTASVTSGDAAAAVATAVAAAINAETTLPVTAAADSGTVTLTARNKGECGNDIDFRLNYYSGQELPAGITAVLTAMASGATNPDVQDAIDVIGDTWYQLFSMPWTDATNMTAMESELDDRYGPIETNEGTCITAIRAANFGAYSTYGNARNSKHTVVMYNNGIPNSPWERAAGLTAIIADEASLDPARPFQTLEEKGILPPADADIYTQTQRNTLLYDGISTFTVTDAGKVLIERVITTYQTNAAGAADTAFLDMNTILTLRYLRWSFRNTFLTKYPRAKLMNDTANIPTGQQVITPMIAKTEVISIFRGWETLGLVEAPDQFIDELTVTRSTTDPNRLEFYLSPDLVNQFRVGAALIQYLL